MNEITLNKQFLESLTKEQKGLLWEYHRLLRTPSTSIDDEVERISQIWSQTSEDSVLCKWLELIDYFYTDSSEINDEQDANKRAYFSEHLEHLLLPATNFNDAETNNKVIPEGTEFLVFVCPDNSGYIRVPIGEDEATTLDQLKKQLCERCNEKLSDHQIMYVEGLTPNQA